MKGIMFDFNLGMHQAFLLGYKTVSRREGALKKINENPDAYILGTHYKGMGNESHILKHVDMSHRAPAGNMVCEAIVPHYNTNEVVFIKEPIIDLFEAKMFTQSGRRILYKYPSITEKGLPVVSDIENMSQLVGSAMKKGVKWKNKMFVGHEHARHYLKISDWRIERLFDITEQDALDEGIMTKLRYIHHPTQWLGLKDYYHKLSICAKQLFKCLTIEDEFVDYGNVSAGLLPSATKSYFSLLEKMHGKEWVAKNPWVFRYEFKKANKDGTNIYHNLTTP